MLQFALMLLTVGLAAQAEPSASSILSNPKYESYLSDPAVQKALQDPQVLQKINDPEIQNALSDPAVRRQLSSPEVRQSLEQKYLNSGEIPSANDLRSPGNESGSPLLIPSEEESSPDGIDYDYSFRLSP